MSSFLSASRDFVKLTRKTMLRLLKLTVIIVKQLSVRLKEAEDFFSPSKMIFFKETPAMYI
jgi:hypothetical protein